MREILYLDTDILTSFMAQENNGLEVFKTAEDVISISKHNFSPSTVAHNSEDFPNENKSRILTNNSASLSNEESSLIKETVSKKLGDDILNYFENHLEKNNEQLKNIENIQIGKYIKHTSAFNIFNLDDMSAIYRVDFQKTYKEVLKRLRQPLSSDYDNNIETARASLNLLKSIMPFHTFITIDNLLVLINDDFLRELANKIAFTCDFHVTLLGRVNKSTDGLSTNDSAAIGSAAINLTNAMNDLAISMLHSLGCIKSKEVYLVTPIAIYF